MKFKNRIKSLLAVLTTMLALAVFISFNYIFLYQIQQGRFLLLVQLLLLSIGLVFYYVKKKKYAIWLALFSCYTISEIYAVFTFLFGLSSSNDCGLFCFASDLVLVQYLFFMPILSIPFFNLAIGERRGFRDWRNNYKIVVILTYLVLLPAIYLHFRG